MKTRGWRPPRAADLERQLSRAHRTAAPAAAPLPVANPYRAPRIFAPSTLEDYVLHNFFEKVRHRPLHLISSPYSVSYGEKINYKDRGCKPFLD